MSQFLKTISRLRWIQRWSLKRNTLPENVMEHSWEVGVIAHLLGVINNRQFQGTLNPERLATLAIYHDSAEAITGDLPTPVKYYSEDIQQAYKVIERDAEKALLKMLPNSLRPAMAEYLQEENIALIERKYIKAADSLSAFIKAKAEIDNGNIEYNYTYNDLLNRLVDYALPEVSYFIEHFVDDQKSASEQVCSNSAKENLHRLNLSPEDQLRVMRLAN